MTPIEAEELKNIFVLLAAAQIHKERNGKVILYFDNSGLQQIGSNKILWRKKSNKINISSS